MWKYWTLSSDLVSQLNPAVPIAAGCIFHWVSWNGIYNPLLLVLRDSAETQDLSSEFNISTPKFYHNLFALHCLSGSAVQVWCHDNPHGVLQNSMHSRALIRLVNNCKNAKFQSWLEDTSKSFCQGFSLLSLWLSFTSMIRRQSEYPMYGLQLKFQITPSVWFLHNKWEIWSLT